MLRHTPRYAYFWQDHRVELVGHPAVVQDPEDVYVRAAAEVGVGSGQAPSHTCVCLQVCS